jgi:hypothetical protein
MDYASITAVQNHRNGSGIGIPFHAVYFDYIMGGKKHELIGIVTKGRGNCFVVSKTDPQMGWRGDHFENDLREVIAQWISQRKSIPIEQARKEVM